MTPPPRRTRPVPVPPNPIPLTAAWQLIVTPAEVKGDTSPLSWVAAAPTVEKAWEAVQQCPSFQDEYLHRWPSGTTPVAVANRRLDLGDSVLQTAVLLARFALERAGGK